MDQSPPSAAPERRREPRTAASLRVFYQHRGAACLVEAQTSNLSLEGVFVRTIRAPLAIGTEVLVSMRLGDGPPLMIRGAVARVRDDGAADRGMGIHFATLDAAELAEIQRFLDRQGSESASSTA